jgi:two-component system nitrate/nitrite response regulator NarL
MTNEKKSGPVRIVIVDDHPIVREGLRLILSTEPDFEVVGQASDGPAGLDAASTLKPDILLLDIDMPRLTGLEVLQALSERRSDVKTIILTASIENNEIVEALRLGARGVIRKETPPRILIRCIQSVSNGKYWVGQEAFSTQIEGTQSLTSIANVRSAKFGLTAKENQVISAVLEGDTNKAIAARLSITEQTVKNHLTNIFNKLGVSNRLELARFAAKNRL